jgi:hypothetical protein
MPHAPSLPQFGADGLQDAGSWARLIQQAGEELRLLAPTAAGGLARLFPAPHTDYLTLRDEARRHAIHLIIAARTAMGLPLDAAAGRVMLTEQRWPHLISRFVPRPPPGLAAVLTRLKGSPWPDRSYRILLDGLRAGGLTADALLSAPELNPDLLDIFAALPPELRQPGLLPLIAPSVLRRMTPVQLACALRDGFALARSAPKAVASRLAARVVSAPTMVAAAEILLRAAMQCRPFDLSVAAAPSDFSKLNSADELKEIGRRFNNCLGRSPYPQRADSGRFAYVEVLGPEPMVVELIREQPLGWRCNEARGIDNARPSAEMEEFLRCNLGRIGAHASKASGTDIVANLRTLARKDVVYPLRPTAKPTE